MVALIITNLMIVFCYNVYDDDTTWGYKIVFLWLQDILILITF